VIHQADQLPGLVAEVEGQLEGLLTYNMKDDMFEIVTLNVLKPMEGIGRLLVDKAVELALSSGCSRIWVITTNDNAPAVKFYDSVGFRIKTIHKGSIKESRRLKPEIPRHGIDGIPITDEIELEKTLG
jgi:GNAT superfamily N-acetyltransferase